MVRVHVKFESSTLTSDSDYLTLQLQLAHEIHVTLHLNIWTTRKVSIALWSRTEKDHAHRWRHTWKMETKHRPSTEDDGVKHYCFALPKITSERVPEGTYEESIGMSGWNLIFNLIIGTNKLVETIFSQLNNVGRAKTFESWPSEKGIKSKWKTKKKTCLWLIGSLLS